MGITDSKTENKERGKVTDILINFKKNGEEDEIMMTAMAKRGSLVSIYAHFMLLEDWDLDEFLPDEHVYDVDIETDMNFYYVRTLAKPKEDDKKKNKNVKKVLKPNFSVYKC